MGQKKIGEFIANLRKERGLTQKQLAEEIGVSDKRISKWECGNGLPEMSSIPLLCKALGINVNELLSGERLVAETYSNRAEENMMTLIKESEKNKKKQTNAVVTLVMSVVGVLAAFLITLLFTEQFMYSVWMYFDIPSFLVIFIPTVIIVTTAGFGKDFFRAFAIMGKNRSQYTKIQVMRASMALKLTANTVLFISLLETLVIFIYLLGTYRGAEAIMEVEIFLVNTAVVLLSLLYGVAFYILLLPVRFRLKVKEQEM